MERGLSDIKTYKQQKFYWLFYMHLQSGGGGCVGVTQSGFSCDWD